MMKPIRIVLQQCAVSPGPEPRQYFVERITNAISVGIFKAKKPIVVGDYLPEDLAQELAEDRRYDVTVNAVKQ